MQQDYPPSVAEKLPETCPQLAEKLPEHLYEPVLTPFMHTSLESRASLAFPVLHFRTTGEGFGAPSAATADFARVLDFIISHLKKPEPEPFLVLYDFRVSRWPPVALCTQGVRAADAHAKAWDGAVQGIAAIIESSVARAFLGMIVKLLKPPQPIAVCKTPEEASKFLASIRQARVYEAQSGRTSSSS